MHDLRVKPPPYFYPSLIQRQDFHLECKSLRTNENPNDVTAKCTECLEISCVPSVSLSLVALLFASVKYVFFPDHFNSRTISFISAVWLLAIDGSQCFLKHIKLAHSIHFSSPLLNVVCFFLGFFLLFFVCLLPSSLTVASLSCLPSVCVQVSHNTSSFSRFRI